MLCLRSYQPQWNSKLSHLLNIGGADFANMGGAHISWGENEWSRWWQ